METAVDISLYRGVEDLPLYNFHKILETGNYAYLIREYDEYKDAPEFDEEELREKFEDIYEAYLKLTDDNKTLMFFMTYSELLYLETRLLAAKMFKQHYEICRRDKSIVEDCAKCLKYWKYKLNPEGKFEDEIKSLERQFRASENKIGLKKHELEQYQDEEGEQLSLSGQVVALEQALGRNEIDPKKISVQKWIDLIKKLESINEERRRTLNRH